MKLLIVLLLSLSTFANYQEINTLRNEINDTTNSNLKLYKSTYHDLSKGELEKLSKKLKDIHSILENRSEEIKYQ